MKKAELVRPDTGDVHKQEQCGGHPKASGNGAKYTCPMHPEVVADKPGACPKCGMSLEPKTVGGIDEQEQHEIRSLSVKFWVGLGLTIPVLILAMGKYIPALHLQSLIPMGVSKWLELILSTPVI